MKVAYQLRDLRWENYMSDYRRMLLVAAYSLTLGVRVLNRGDKWIAEKILIIGDEDE